MNELTITIPDVLQQWVDRRLSDGEYADAADYLRDLLRRDRAFAVERDRLRAQIEEGLASEIDPRTPREIIAAIIAEDPDLRG